MAYIFSGSQKASSFVKHLKKRASFLEKLASFLHTVVSEKASSLWKLARFLVKWSPEFLCSRSDSRHLEVHVATAGGWLTRYRPREVRNSIYRYRKIHIDYRSKFSYRFISPISIIYGNTRDECNAWSTVDLLSIKLWSASAYFLWKCSCYQSKNILVHEKVI